LGGNKKKPGSQLRQVVEEAQSLQLMDSEEQG
jgi:hypothetical protein